MVLDLGAQTSVLSERLVDRLHLPRDPTALPTISGVGGSNMRWAANVGRVAFGGVVLEDKRMEVAPIAMGAGQQALDGALGLDVLRRYDVDWDLPHGRVTFYAPSGCDGPPAQWPAAVAVPLHHPSASGRDAGTPRLLLIPVLVDGREVTALLDTGAGVSLIAPATAAAAEDFAGDGGAQVMLSGVGSSTETGHLRHFRSITVGGQTEAAWPMVVAPVPAWAGQMILGVRYLRLHRAWLPAGGATIWFAPRAAPGAVTGSG